MNPQTMRAIAQIESGGNPNAVTGSYKGLYQLSEPEFRRYGGQGSIFDPAENTRIAGLKLEDERNQLSAKLGRPVTDSELYLAHQQGVGGAFSHLSNPDQPAWMSMYQTAEGQQKGPEWAKRAIWGNIPDQYKSQFGDVGHVTSGQFTDMWGKRFDRAMGNAPDTPDAQTASAATPSPASATPASAPQSGGMLASISNLFSGNAPQATQQPGGEGSPLLSSLGSGLNQQAMQQAMQVPQGAPIYYAPRRAPNLAPLQAALQGGFYFPQKQV